MKIFSTIFLLILAGCNVGESEFAPDSPLIILTFDDGHRSILDLAFPEMQKYGYPGVSFIPSGWINGPDFLTLDEVREMEQQGWETGGHSVTHANLTTIPVDSARSEIRLNYEHLVGYGLMHKSFALPAGHSNSEIDEIILEYFDIIRTSHNERYRYPLNITKLGYYQAEDNDDANSLLLRIAHGINEGESMIIFGFHQFTEGEPTFITMLRMSAFRGLLNGIKERNLEVLTLSAAVDRLIK
jgi:peptidoglycan/xylan/chitin deacetylase (PgdA/CDA1 family)